MAEPKYTHNFKFGIDPTLLKSGETVLERWAVQLASYVVLVDNGFGPEKDPFLRYCIFLSEGSGLHAAIPEWPDRKKEALRLAGVKPDHPRYQLVLDMKDEAVQDMRWAWMKAFNSRKFRAYVAGCEAYDQNCRKVETPIPDAPPNPEKGDMKEDAVQRAYKLRNDLLTELPGQDTLLAKMEAELFMGDDELKRLAADRAKPQAESGSIEAKIMGRKQK